MCTAVLISMTSVVEFEEAEVTLSTVFPHIVAMATWQLFFFERSILQTFWKHDRCTKSLVFFS